MNEIAKQDAKTPDADQTQQDAPAATDKQATTDSLDDLKSQVADAYIALLDKTKWWLFSLASEIGVVSPMQASAKEYLLSTAEKKSEKTWFWDRLKNNVKKNLEKKFLTEKSSLSKLSYAQKDLDAMKLLISKWTKEALDGYLTMMDEGKNPTKVEDPTKVKDLNVAPVVAATWAGIAAGTALEQWEVARKEYTFPILGAKINSPIGMRTIEELWTYMHKGVDIAAIEGTPILSIADAIVESVGFGSAAGFNWYGNYMQVKLKNWYRVLYGHMSKPAQKADGTEWKKWDTIKWWEQVGYVGHTWITTAGKTNVGGDHLHLEIRKGSFESDDKNFFARDYIDPIPVLPITKDMVTPYVLSVIDKSSLMA